MLNPRCRLNSGPEGTWIFWRPSKSNTVLPPSTAVLAFDTWALCPCPERSATEPAVESNRQWPTKPSSAAMQETDAPKTTTAVSRTGRMTFSPRCGGQPKQQTIRLRWAGVHKMAGRAKSKDFTLTLDYRKSEAQSRFGHRSAFQARLTFAAGTFIMESFSHQGFASSWPRIFIIFAILA